MFKPGTTLLTSNTTHLHLNDNVFQGGTVLCLCCSRIAAFLTWNFIRGGILLGVDPSASSTPQQWGRPCQVQDVLFSAKQTSYGNDTCITPCCKMKSKISLSACTLRAPVHLNDPDLPHLEPPHPLAHTHGPVTLFKLSLEKLLFFELCCGSVGLSLGGQYVYGWL